MSQLINLYKSNYIKIGLTLVTYIGVSIALSGGTVRGSLISEFFNPNIDSYSAFFWVLLAVLVVSFTMFAWINIDAFSNQIFWLGIVILFTHSWVLYDFYHANSYTTLIFYVLVILLFLKEDLFKLSLTQTSKKLLAFCILLLPVVSCLPGALYNGFSANYNFVYELASFIPAAIFGSYIYALAEDDKDIFSFLKWFAFTVIVLGIWSFYEYYSNRQDPNYRVIATFGNTTYFSTYLITIIPLLVYPIFNISSNLGSSITLRDLKFIPKFEIFLFALTVGIITLFLTATKASQFGLFIAFIIGVFLFFHSFYPQKFFKYFLYFLLLFGGIVCALLFVHFMIFEFNFVNRFLNIPGLEVFYPRLIGWIPAWRAFLDSPLVGHGLGSSYNTFFEFMWERSLLFHNELSYNHVHNEFLEIAAEGGIVGLIGSLILPFGLIIFLIRVAYTEKFSFNERILAILLIMSLVGYYVDSLFSISQRHIAGRLPYYVCLGLGLSLANRKLGILNGIKKLPSFIFKRVTLVVIFGLFFVWNGYYFSKWIYTQYKHVQSFSFPEFSSIQAKQRALSLHRDIYLLDNLGNTYYKEGLLDDEIKNGAIIDQVIQNYRLSKYRSCLSMIGLQRFSEALERCQSYWQKNPYYHQNNLTLIALSLVLDEKQIFLNSLKDGILFFLTTNHKAIYSDSLFLSQVDKRIFSPLTVIGASINDDLTDTDQLKLEFKDEELQIHVNSNFYANLRQEMLSQNKNLFNRTRFIQAQKFTEALFEEGLIQEQLNTTDEDVNQKNRLVIENLAKWLLSIGNIF